jgi:putative transposase
MGTVPIFCIPENGDSPHFFLAIQRRIRNRCARTSGQARCMPRSSRIIAPGYCYHVINRGNNKATVFHEHADYAAFVALMRDAQERVELPILGLCLMPNHVHFVVRPTATGDLSRWAHWLFTTHVRRYHNKYGTTGRVWQDRFKQFVIEEDSHFLTVLRYVERNALRSNLVRDARDWLWGSLRWRSSPHPAAFELAPSPVPLPNDWSDFVNKPQTQAELEALRDCVNRQRPFGTPQWVERTSAALGLNHSRRATGRPRSE